MEETTKKKKERHIVTWTQEEDDILRKQISLHGTENWAIIASKFNDKTTRQCRRRWYTYLNSDFKRGGGWSPEEDTLLCEAQRLFGNRWTEIAKLVSGRTDNAVKNRFTTLCKKRAKFEAMDKQNRIASCLNSNKKRMLFLDGISTPRKAENESPLAKKMRRSHILDHTEIYGDRSHLKVDSGVNQKIRPPFSVLVHNATRIDSTEEMNQTSNAKDHDRKNSMAQKVNGVKTEQSLENALKDFLFRSGISDINFHLLVEDLSSNGDSQTSWRQSDLHDSPASSEYSSGSIVMPQPMSDSQTIKLEQNGRELLQDKEIVSDATVEQLGLLSTCHDVLKNPNEIVTMSVEEEFNSPVQVTPLFRSLAAGIPSPQFSESERNFLLKTLGVESPCPNVNPSKPPPCKRVLLDSL